MILDDGREAAARVYLDHNATSPVRPEAAAALAEWIDRPSGNPSSLHAEGRAAMEAMEQAREQVAELAGVPGGSLVFTSGGSEAIEAAIRGVCDRAPSGLRKIVLGAVEHSAVFGAARAFTSRRFTVEEVPCDRDGRVDPDRFLARLDRGTVLAVLQWANNETGVLQPVKEVGEGCRKAGVPFLVDAVQIAGKKPLGAAESFADFLALSSHKIGGVPGAGALTVRKGIMLAPLIHGGAQEKRRRGGTPALPAVIGFGAAAGACLEGMKTESGRLLKLRARIETQLRELLPEIRFHGQAANRLPNTVNFAVPGIEGEMLAIGLDMAGFAVSTGSACASGAVEPSHVLQAMRLTEEEARGAIRVSLGWNSTLEDVNRFLSVLPEQVNRIREARR
jgi:cysteine desulfurase